MNSSASPKEGNIGQLIHTSKSVRGPPIWNEQNGTLTPALSLRKGEGEEIVRAVRLCSLVHGLMRHFFGWWESPYVPPSLGSYGGRAGCDDFQALLNLPPMSATDN